MEELEIIADLLQTKAVLTKTEAYAANKALAQIKTLIEQSLKDDSKEEV